MRHRFATAVACAALAAACAEGSSITNPAGAGGLGGGGLGDGGSGGDGGDDGPATTSSQASSSATSVASSSSSGGGEGGGEATSSSSSSTTSTSSGQGCNFTSPNACANAESLGSIAGDESGTPVTLAGSTSKWFTVRIEERASGISETDLSYRVSLSSPAGMNYDLIVHEGPQDGDQDCGAPPIQGQSNGSAEAVSASWDDDQGIGGEDDSLWLMIEVRYVSGEACSVSDQWTLTIEGYV